MDRTKIQYLMGFCGKSRDLLAVRERPAPQDSKRGRRSGGPVLTESTSDLQLSGALWPTGQRLFIMIAEVSNPLHTKLWTDEKQDFTIRRAGKG